VTKTKRSNDVNKTSRFCDQEIEFENGVRGINIQIPSAAPSNYYEVLGSTGQLEEVVLDGKLFLPPGSKESTPLVIIVPGSLGVAPSHVRHAETLCTERIASFVLDTFGARDITSTVANQTQFSFAASAYDVLAAYKVLANRPEIDSQRIGAQGHSRGGSAVLTAVSRRFSDVVLGKEHSLAATYAAYPWCGQQFLNPGVGNTEVRIILGDADEWCSVAQAQGHAQAVRLAGGQISLRVVPGAQHSFDRDTPIEMIADASVSPSAPVTYIADDGAMIHPLTGTPDAALVDRDVMVYALKAGFGQKGARIGSRPGEAEIFRSDMLGFWRKVLLK